MFYQLRNAEEKNGLGYVQQVKRRQEAEQQVEILLKLLPTEHHYRAEVTNYPETSHSCLKYADNNSFVHIHIHTIKNYTKRTPSIIRVKVPAMLYPL